MAAEEATAQNRKTVWTAEGDAFGHAVAAVAKEKEGDGDLSQKTARAVKEIDPNSSAIFKKSGTCKYGANCRYLHATESGKGK